MPVNRSPWTNRLRSAVEGLDPERVLSVEEARHQELALPPQLAIRLRGQDRRLDRHALAARRLQADGQLLALLHRACDRR